MIITNYLISSFLCATFFIDFHTTSLCTYEIQLCFWKTPLILAWTQDYQTKIYRFQANRCYCSIISYKKWIIINFLLNLHFHWMHFLIVRNIHSDLRYLHLKQSFDKLFLHPSLNFSRTLNTRYEMKRNYKNLQPITCKLCENNTNFKIIYLRK